MLPETKNRWVWDLDAAPASLWPYVANTDRFNRDSDLPPVVELTLPKNGRLPANARRLIQFRLPLLQIQWEEEPFEWQYPHQFGVVRHYSNGPLQQMRVRVQLLPKSDGGTCLVYETWIKPRNIWGRLGWPLVARFSKWRFTAVFAQYDALALAGKQHTGLQKRPRLASGGKARLAKLGQQLVAQGHAPSLVYQLGNLLQTGDDLALVRLRPYALADQWHLPRPAVLTLALSATRAGLLNLQWDVLCPHCRGSQESHAHLTEIETTVHCKSCQIDFEANFSQSVELTFMPNPNIRPVTQQTYCMAGPEVTPHVVLQQLLAEGESRIVQPHLENGRYRLRTLGGTSYQYLRTQRNGQPEATFTITDAGWQEAEPVLTPTPTLSLENQTATEQLLILERLAWHDTATTAAEVTTMQHFRDLFADEILRPGEQISVGSLTFLFTDLCASTQLYQEVGDATAFGLVMDHFDVLQDAIAAEGGALVKTIGDAVLAVFCHPVAALKAILRGQQELACGTGGKRPLHLRAALHYGPAIAVTLNERLDYFGTTVNIASRLEKFSQGNDVILSDTVFHDPEVQHLLRHVVSRLAVHPFSAKIKGFSDEQFRLWRVWVR